MAVHVKVDPLSDVLSQRFTSSERERDQGVLRFFVDADAQLLGQLAERGGGGAAGHAVARFSASTEKTCGRIARRYISRAGGIPLRRHSLTDGARTAQSLATAVVPPSASMISDAVMPPSIGVPKSILQGMPKKKRIRLAYMGTWNQRVKEAREAAKLSQAEFARRVGVRQPTVFEWEGGETKTLKGPNLLKVASVLGVTPEWLLTGKGGRAANSVPADEPSPQEPTPEVLELAAQLMTLNEDQRTAVLRTVLAYGEVRAAAKAKQKARGARDARPSGKRHRPIDTTSKP